MHRDCSTFPASLVHPVSFYVPHCYELQHPVKVSVLLVVMLVFSVPRIVEWYLCHIPEACFDTPGYQGFSPAALAFRIMFLAFQTALSACTLDAGCSGLDVVCVNEQSSENCLNVPLEKVDC